MSSIFEMFNAVGPSIGTNYGQFSNSRVPLILNFNISEFDDGLLSFYESLPLLTVRVHIVHASHNRAEMLNPNRTQYSARKCSFHPSVNALFPQL